MLPTEIPCLDEPPAHLRAFRPDDAPRIASVTSDPLIPLITSVPSSNAREDITAYLGRQHRRLVEGAGYSFPIADAVTDDAVGNIGLWTEQIATGRASTGYWIAPQHRRRGYARAALESADQVGHSPNGVKRLELFAEPWNKGSRRIAEDCGFQR